MGTPLSIAAQEAQRGWPSQNARDYRGPNALPFSERGGGKKGEQLPNFVAHAWKTPCAKDGDQAGSAKAYHQTLHRQVTTTWPTPTAGDAASSGSAGYGTESGRSEGTTLTDAVVGPRGPLSRETPTGGEPTSTDGRTPRLLSLVLNPFFVEALMGWPLGWTLISDTASTDCASSETAWSPTRQHLPGRCSCNG